MASTSPVHLLIRSPDRFAIKKLRLCSDSFLYSACRISKVACWEACSLNRFDKKRTKTRRTRMPKPKRTSGSSCCTTALVGIDASSNIG